MKNIFYSVLIFLMIIATFFSCKKDTEIPSQSLTNKIYPKGLIKVPLTRQATDYTCGAAAFQSILYYYGIEYMETDVAAMVNSDTINGTRYLDIKQAAESLNFSVEIKKNATIAELKNYLDDGHPLLVLIQAWTEEDSVDWANDWIDGHYVVAIGYDNTNIYFMDPSTLGNYTYIPLPEFLDRWHDVDSQNDTCRNFIMSIQKFSPPVYIPTDILRIN